MVFERKAYLNYLVGCEGNGMNDNWLLITDYSHIFYIYSGVHQAKASDDWLLIIDYWLLIID